MIQDAMLFALGFLIAILLALACLPAVWGRALRLTRRRLEMLVPLSAEEINAERDGLRAKAAVVQRQLEQRLEQALSGSATLAADLGHRTVRLVATEEALAAARHEGQGLEAERSRLARLLVEAEAQLGGLQTALYAAEGGMLHQRASYDDLTARHERLGGQVEQQRAAVAALETRSAGLEARLQDREADADRLSADKTSLVGLLGTAMQERDTARAEAQLATSQRGMLHKELEAELARGGERQSRLFAKSEALADAERRIMELTAENKASRVALDELRGRFEALGAKLIAAEDRRDAGVPISEDEGAALRREIAAVADKALEVAAPRAGTNGEPPRTETPPQIADTMDTGVLL